MRRIRWRAAAAAASALGLSPWPSAAHAAAGAPSPEAAQNDEQDVVITAARRAQRLETAPASISAFTAGDMAALGAKTFADLTRYAPGVTYDYLTHNIAMRGLASTAGANMTGIYIDDTPIQMRALDFNPNNALPALFDLDRVEVLRGPQGTLYGAGSVGGAVRYITAEPSLTAYSGLARAELSATAHGGPSEEAGLAFGGPIAKDTLGFRISAWKRHDGGWIDQVDSATGATRNANANAVDTESARAALTWRPGARLTVTPSLVYQYRDQHFYDQYWLALSDPGAGRFRSGTPDAMADRDRFYLPALAVRYDFDKMSFISNSSYFTRHERVNGYSGTLYDLSYFQQLLDPSQPGGPIDPAGNPCGACRSDLFPLLTAGGYNLPGLPNFRVNATILNSQMNYTQEFRLQSNDPNARLAWIAGLFFADNREHSTDVAVDPYLDDIAHYLFGEGIEDITGVALPPSGIEYINDTISHDRQIAAYADATFAVTEKLNVSAGLRYAYTRFTFRNFSDGPLNFGLAGGSGAQTEHPLTPRASVSYQFDRDNMAYASVAQGYRMGGANAPFPQSLCQADLTALQISSVPASYSSDTVLNYEAGLRNALLDRRLTTALSVFHSDWDRIQQSNYLPSCGFAYTANLGAAKSDGFELYVHAAPTHALSFDLSVGYIDARYSTTVRSGDAPGAPILVAAGDSLGASRWTLALGGQYDFPAFGNPAYVRADYTFDGGDPRLIPTRDPASANYDPFLPKAPAVAYFSARTGLTLGKSEWMLFVDNVFDSHPQLNLYHLDKFTLLLEAATLRPRTAGVSVSYKY